MKISNLYVNKLRGPTMRAYMSIEHLLVMLNIVDIRSMDKVYKKLFDRMIEEESRAERRATAKRQGRIPKRF